MIWDKDGIRVEQMPAGTTGHVEEDDSLCLPSTDERFGEEEIHRWTKELYEFRSDDGYSRFVRLYQGEIVSILCVTLCGEIEWVFTVEECRRKDLLGSFSISRPLSGVDR